MRAHLLLAETYTAAGWLADAEAQARPVVAQCTELGLSRVLVDARLG